MNRGLLAVTLYSNINRTSVMDLINLSRIDGRCSHSLFLPRVSKCILVFVHLLSSTWCTSKACSMSLWAQVKYLQAYPCQGGRQGSPSLTLNTHPRHTLTCKCLGNKSWIRAWTGNFIFHTIQIMKLGKMFQELNYNDRLKAIRVEILLRKKKSMYTHTCICPPNQANNTHHS